MTGSFLFAADSSGTSIGDGIQVDVERSAGGWSAHFKIPWEVVEGRPIREPFGLNIVRSRGQSSEVLSPVALDQTFHLPPDLLMCTCFGEQTAHHGIVYIPKGRYRLDHTIYVWAGIRLIGYGAKRSVFVLPANSPDFQSGPDHYMIWFTDERTPPGEPIADASEFTFCSALSNIDFELNDGNPTAVAIRFNVAQHSFIAYADFKLRSAKAALEAIGNQASDIHVHGGRYGIITGKQSAHWALDVFVANESGECLWANSFCDEVFEPEHAPLFQEVESTGSLLRGGRHFDKTSAFVNVSRGFVSTARAVPHRSWFLSVSLRAAFPLRRAFTSSNSASTLGESCWPKGHSHAERSPAES
jgi:hypothetical protein